MPIVAPATAALATAGGLLWCGAFIVVTLAHEVLGHGLAAVALGWRLLGFYLSPVYGVALFVWPPEGIPVPHRFVILLAGPAAQCTTGVLALWEARRVRQAVPRMFLYYIGLWGVLGVLVYAASDLLTMGGGDFATAVSLAGLSGGVPLGLAAAIAGIWTTFRLGRLGLEFISAFQPFQSYRGRLAALLATVLPGVLLQSAYIAAFRDAMSPEQFLQVAAGEAVGLLCLVTVLPVAAIGRVPAAALRPICRASLLRAGGASFVLVALIPVVFGPTFATARAVTLTPYPESWMLKSPAVNLDLVLMRDLNAAAVFAFKTLPRPFPSAESSPLWRRQFTRVNRQATFWGYYDAFVVRNSETMLGRAPQAVTAREIGRPFWVNGREEGDGRVVSVRVPLWPNIHMLRWQDPDSSLPAGEYRLYIAPDFTDPIDRSSIEPGRVRIVPGSGVIIDRVWIERAGGRVLLATAPVAVWQPQPGSARGGRLVVSFRMAPP